MSAVTPKATIDSTEYHHGQLEFALGLSWPEHILPAVETARVGAVDVGCDFGQLFVASGSAIQPGASCYGFDIDSSSIAHANCRLAG